MTEHGDTCYLDPAHHACAVARAARAEGALAEARRVAAEALAASHHGAVAAETLRRVAALREEFTADLETRGQDWHPRARAMVAQVVELLGAALGPEQEEEG